jgi:hypothetical protein
MSNLKMIKLMLEPTAWGNVAQYKAWLACMVQVGRYMNGGNADGKRCRLEFVPGTADWQLDVVMAELELVGAGDEVVSFEEGGEARLDVVFLLNELLHEVRGLREELAGLWEEKKPVPIIISGKSGIDPEWIAEIRRMMGWG